MNDKLDDIFADYDARKGREGKESAAREDAENQVGTACMERLRRLIPTLETFVDKVNAAGHQGGIVEYLRSHAHARVTFTFRPKGLWEDSKLAFGCLVTGRVSVSAEVNVRNHSTTSDRDRSDADPTTEWVEKNVLWFIEEVLNGT